MERSRLDLDEQNGMVARPANVSLLYRSAWSQLLFTSFVGFCCPGMLNALNGMGGGGNVDPTISANAAVVLMLMSAVSYLILCVPLFEVFGVRLVRLGGWTFALWTATMLNYANGGSGGLVIASGALLGVGSSFFWVVQGAVMISYPPAHQKGLAITVFWIIFNLGGMVGALIAFRQTLQKADDGTVSNTTYSVIILIMLLGAALSCFLIPLEVSDISRVSAERLDKRSTVEMIWRTAKRQLVEFAAIRHETRLMLLIPMFLAANWFYSYQQNVMNGESFDLKGRTFNSALYWLSQIVAPLCLPLLDLAPFSRRSRAMMAWTVLFVFGNIVMIYGNRFEGRRDKHGRNWIAFGTNEYWYGAGLYSAYGALDALWQGVSYWLLGALCSTPSAAGKLVAVYKVSQSIGAAIAYQMTTSHVSGHAQFLSNWVMMTFGLLIAIPAILNIEEPEEVSGYMIVGH